MVVLSISCAAALLKRQLVVYSKERRMPRKIRNVAAGEPGNTTDE